MTYYWYTWIALTYVLLAMVVGWIISFMKITNVIGENKFLTWEYLLTGLLLSGTCACLAFSVIKLDELTKKNESDLTDEEKNRYIPLYMGLTASMFIVSIIWLIIILNPENRVAP
jgi:hypothetical protein